MAAVTSVNNRFVVALGPIKLEILNVTGSDTNTVTTTLQRPLIAIGAVSSDAVTMTESVNVAISGKTLTINSTDFASDIMNI